MACLHPDLRMLCVFRRVAKRVTSLQISEDGKFLLTADKTGAVTRFATDADDTTHFLRKHSLR